MEIEKTTRYKAFKKYQSLDNGVTWVVVDPDEYEYVAWEQNSIDCGYIPPITGDTGTTTDGCKTVAKYPNNFVCETPRSVIRSDTFSNKYFSTDDYFNFKAATKLDIGNCAIIIGKSAFKDWEKITSVVIPNSVARIGGGAFSGCSGLTSVSISDSVESIGYEAFRFCTSLSSITIPNSVTSIGSGAFSNCTSLTSASIGSGVTSVVDSAFESCESLTSITIPNSVTSIGSGAFSNCTSLTSIIIPNSVTSIGNNAFAGCISLTSVSISDSVTSIGSSAFDGCEALSAITIPNSVTSIGSGAFSNCTSLTSIIIPNSVTSIGVGTFDNCSYLTSVTIPNSITRICSFKNCTNLTSINFNGTTSQWCSMKKDYPWNDGVPATVVHCIDGDIDISCTTTGSTTEKCETILVYTDGATKEFSINGEITQNSIESDISNTTYVASVYIGTCATSIGLGAFYNFKNLKYVTIPNSIISIGVKAFMGCGRLSSINFNGTTSQWCSMTKGVEWNYGVPATVVHCTDGDIDIDCITGICETIVTYVDGTSKSYSITGALKGTYIDNRPNAKIVDIGTCVTSITDSSFDNWDNMEKITIPSSVKSFGNRVFAGLAKLTTITIPSSISSIGYSIFENSTLITEITYLGTKAQWNAIAKDLYWKANSYLKTIHCTDGDITL